MSFAICHQCHWYRWDTLSEFLKELKLPKCYTIWSPVEMIHEKIWSERSRKTVPLSKSDNIWLWKKMPALCRRKRERRRLFIRDRALNYQYLPLRVYQLMTSGCLRDFVFLMVRQWSFICAQEDQNFWWAKWRLSTFDLDPWGERHGVQGQICGILRPQLAMNRFLPLWPHRFPHFGCIHLGGRGRGGALILDRCRAFDLFAGVDAHLWFN
jgi:hypothetical protein